MAIASGTKTYRVAFDAPRAFANGQGGTRRDWVESCRCQAAIRWLRGGETVMQGRLAGRQPAVVTVDRSPATRAIGTDWRMRLIEGGQAGEQVFAIRAIVPSDDWAEVELTCESGVSP